MARYHHGNLRTVLIEAGLDLIEKQGVSALTLREIAKRVGVSRMAPYRHFADKTALLAAISEAGFSQFAAALQTARDAAPKAFGPRITAMGLAYVRFAAEHRAQYEVMFSTNAHTESAERAFRILEETIEEGQRSGEARKEDPTQVARLVWALVHGVSTLRLETDLTALTRWASEMLLTGITTNAAAIAATNPCHPDPEHPTPGQASLGCQQSRPHE